MNKKLMLLPNKIQDRQTILIIVQSTLLPLKLTRLLKMLTSVLKLLVTAVSFKKAKVFLLEKAVTVTYLSHLKSATVLISQTSKEGALPCVVYL